MKIEVNATVLLPAASEKACRSARDTRSFVVFDLKNVKNILTYNKKKVKLYIMKNSSSKGSI